MKKSKAFALTAVAIAALFAILSFFGIWVPNRFGTGMLWLGITILLAIWFINTDYEVKEGHHGTYDDRHGPE